MTTSTRRSGSTALTLVLAAVLVVGCGGDDDSEPSPGCDELAALAAGPAIDFTKAAAVEAYREQAAGYEQLAESGPEELREDSRLVAAASAQVADALDAAGGDFFAADLEFLADAEPELIAVADRFERFLERECDG